MKQFVTLRRVLAASCREASTSFWHCTCFIHSVFPPTEGECACRVFTANPTAQKLERSHRAGGGTARLVLDVFGHPHPGCSCWLQPDLPACLPAALFYLLGGISMSSRCILWVCLSDSSFLILCKHFEEMSVGEETSDRFWVSSGPCNVWFLV